MSILNWVCNKIITCNRLEKSHFLKIITDQKCSTNHISTTNRNLVSTDITSISTKHGEYSHFVQSARHCGGVERLPLWVLYFTFFQASTAVKTSYTVLPFRKKVANEKERRSNWFETKTNSSAVQFKKVTLRLPFTRVTNTKYKCKNIAPPHKKSFFTDKMLTC